MYKNTINNVSWGINVSHSGGNTNDIYKNTLSNILGASFRLKGQNKSASDIGSTGLKILCNDMKENYPLHKESTDIYVMSGYGLPTNINGIAKYQGKIFVQIPYDDEVGAESAGNKFNYKIDHPQSIVYNNIHKESEAFTFNYYYNSGTAFDMPHKYNVPIINSTAPACLDRFDNGIVTVHPYAVDAIMRLASIENAISDVLALPELTNVEDMALDGYHYMKKLLLDSLINGYLYADSTEVYYDSVAYVLEQVVHGYEYKVQLAGVYGSLNRYNDAIALLNSLPEAYQLDSLASEDMALLATLYQTLKDLVDNGDHWDSLSSEAHQDVLDIVEKTELLYAYPLAQYLKMRYIVDTAGADRGHSNGGFIAPKFPSFNEREKQNGLFSIYPNPVSDILTIEAKTNNTNNATLIILDINGRQLIKVKLKGQKQNIDISTLPKGLYVAEIIQNNKSIFTQKISKQ